MPKNGFENYPHDVSRRGFLKGALIGGAGLTMASPLALAEQMMTGRPARIQDIRGFGAEPGVVRMNLNENPIGPSPRAILAIAENIWGINRYGGSDQPLQQALAAFDGVKLPAATAGRRAPGPYLFTAGSGSALNLLTLAYLSREGGELIEAELGYGQVARSADAYKETFGVPSAAVRVPMTKDYKHDLQAMRDAITPRTKVILITNPNNPTGTLIPPEELERFVDDVPENIVVVFDEAYIHFVESDKLPSMVHLAMSRDNVAVMRTFSKVYAMPAMRLGYCLSGQKIQTEMRKYMAGGPNMLATAAGAEAVKDMDHVQRSREAAWAFKKQMYKGLDAMGLGYVPSHTTFMMVDLKRPSEPIYQKLQERNVLVSSRSRSPGFTNWFRVSAGTKEETEVFLNTLKDVMAT